jgi:hypothetical protein
MKWIYGLLVIVSFSQFQCDQADVNKSANELDKANSTCTKTAIVKDLTGLDGCGFALELANGSKLIPQRLVYIQAPDPAQDPIYYFQFKAGQKVCFDYREAEGVDTCMAGKLVFITCIKVCE